MYRFVQVVQEKQEAATVKTKEAQAIADDAQKDLNEALPALEAALASLKSLNKNDVVEVRALQRPPDGVRLVIEAVCIMKSVKPKRVAGEKVPLLSPFALRKANLLSCALRKGDLLLCKGSHLE